MKRLLSLSLITLSLYADRVDIDNFESDLFSNDRQTLRKIDASFSFEGRDLRVNKRKIVDSLNIIISSFFIEDLLTSKGKEKFKELLTQYITSRHSVDIDEIYIKKMRLKNAPTDIDAIIKALKKEGFTKPKKSVVVTPSPVQRVFESTPIPISSSVQTTTTVPPIIETYDTTPPSSSFPTYENTAPKRTWK